MGSSGEPAAWNTGARSRLSGSAEPYWGGRVESVGDDLVLCTGGSGLSAAASRGLDSCKSQAVALASTYVHKLSPEAADVIIEISLNFERLVDDDKERLSPEEAVLRARRIARDEAI